MHFRTDVAARSHGACRVSTSRTEYADVMVEHDGDVGKLLKAIDDAGIAGDTIVLYRPTTACT